MQPHCLYQTRSMVYSAWHLRRGYTLHKKDWLNT
jgi:hypothetical protein